MSPFIDQFIKVLGKISLRFSYGKRYFGKLNQTAIHHINAPAIKGSEPSNMAKQTRFSEGLSIERCGCTSKTQFNNILNTFLSLQTFQQQKRV